ncbi:M28 family peptidase [Algibacter amylolyticus]|uniref:M28 family peptidase n=1 Tax=Algibacter amylolyticus TaxID=1608400 RepID=A0A5M7B5D7_9FLAO|nr:M28 family metallopeptidase [Algibacter amylolyticus]KAA5823567.1 M28 family peptidase [Algibacter amylolyticus]MBB5267724.1 Zn-dependent M28 family amino/carboxypeptidase [Algibacter amylolyticus]TSJ74055.1 M28 family peptidase [Algibacter amylolyticus]
MKTLALLICASLQIASCSSSQNKNKTEKETTPETYANTITASELKTMLYTYASDDFEGRKTGEPGQKKAIEFIKSNYQSNNILSPIAEDDYFQEIPGSYFGNNVKDSENVIAYIKGSEKPDEVIIISAHLDHIGISGNGDINNGADDDGSGTVAILEIAEAFKAAEKEGNGPKRTVVFLHVTGEEIGLYGSRYYSDEDPIFPLKNTVANLNIDMIGRVDPKHEARGENYLYLIGADKLSKELHTISEDVNKKYFNLEFDYTYNDDNDPNRFYYRSDHYNFAKNNIPVIFYFNGTHADYHKPSDTPDKINYEFLETRAKLIFHTAWELANREERIKLD